VTIALPLFRVQLDDEILASLAASAQRVMASGHFVLGKEVAAFESEFAEFCHTSHCVGVGNGTDALELALRSVGVAANHRVITVANAGYYSTAAINAIGAVPCYVDVGVDLNIDPERVQDQLPGARAIVVTHLYGRAAQVDKIVELADKCGIPVVEDCSQAHGAWCGGRRVGTIGVAGCFSFYPTKNLGALGDGGAVVTDSAECAKRVRSLRQYGWESKYDVRRIGGRNSRLDEIQAAFLRVKLPFVDLWNEHRRAIATQYLHGLCGLPLGLAKWDDRGYVAHLFVIRCRDRAGLRDALARAGVGTEIHYPIPDYAQLSGQMTSRAHLPVTEAACNEVLSLPCFPGMTMAQANLVIGLIRSHFESRNHG
jgi:dTDP-4-amino-4,6-dideoxygalactose transaminase